MCTHFSVTPKAAWEACVSDVMGWLSATTIYCYLWIFRENFSGFWKFNIVIYEWSQLNIFFNLL